MPVSRFSIPRFSIVSAGDAPEAGVEVMTGVAGFQRSKGDRQRGRGPRPVVWYSDGRDVVYPYATNSNIYGTELDEAIKVFVTLTKEKRRMKNE